MVVQRRQAQRGLRGRLPRRPRQPQARLRTRARLLGIPRHTRLQAACSHVQLLSLNTVPQQGAHLFDYWVSLV